MFKWFEEMGIGDSQGADLMGYIHLIVLMETCNNSQAVLQGD